MDYSWDKAAPYMTALQELVLAAHRESNNAQMMEPLTDALPAAIAKVEALRRGITGG